LVVACVRGDAAVAAGPSVGPLLPACSDTGQPLTSWAPAVSCNAYSKPILHHGMSYVLHKGQHCHVNFW
jgi:hypothetical protein